MPVVVPYATQLGDLIQSERVEARRAFAHLLSMIPYKKVPREKVELPKRKEKGSYDDQAILKGRKFIPEVY